jgi:P22_AR N-terminal domain
MMNKQDFDNKDDAPEPGEQENEQELQVLVPIVQETILFHGKPIVVVRLPNGEPGVVLRWICENLHLSPQSQINRIKRTEVIAGDLVHAQVQTEGGPQVMATLVLHSAPYWLATIDTRRMDKDDERRLEILDYQRNAVAALYRWAESAPQETLPANVVPDQAIIKPESPGPGAPLIEWKLYHDQMSVFLQWQIDVEEWRGNIDNRVGYLETITSRILKQIGPPRITVEQQNLIQYYVSQLNQVTGKHQQTIFAALKTSFRVPRYDEIYESDWPNVEKWFKQQFPNHQLPPTQEKLF